MNYFCKKTDRNNIPLKWLEEQQAHFTQSPAYFNWQKDFGRKCFRQTIYNQNNQPVAFWQGFKYNLPIRQSYLIIPHGPIIADDSPEIKKMLNQSLKEIMTKNQCLFIYFDPQIKTNNIIWPEAKPAGNWQPKPTGSQPQLEWVVSLTEDEDKMWLNFKSQARNLIRKAEKNKVKIKEYSSNLEDHFENFYRLMTDTAQRQHFNLHPKDYYLKFFLAEENETKVLINAEYEDQIIATVILVKFGNRVLYLFGGTDSKARTLQASYLIHWHGLKWALKQKASTYSFGGIKNKNTDNLSTFKRKFPGIVENYGSGYFLINRYLPFQIYRGLRLIKDFKKDRF
ncbi:MAG: lipid II:glycine glycyltransferase FemX [Patescibacteria group bacterium]